MGHGIDYGMGRTNIDHATGVRYGVIPVNDVCQAWCDSSEPYYGDPTCPECGCDVTDDPETARVKNDDERGDYYCADCDEWRDSEYCFPESALSFFIDDGEYKASADSEGDIFITSSPYYTRAAYCSPCAPGACHLRNPCDDGDRAYCFGHDFFEEGRAPYRVFSVATDEEVFPAS